MWLHVPSECLASVRESADSTLDSESRFPPPELWCTSSGKPTPRPVSWPGWKSRPWIRVLSGTTCSPSTAQRGAEQLIASSQAGPVHPQVLPGSDSARQMNGGSGRPSSECFLRFSPDGSSVKTSPDFSALTEAWPSETFSVTWPRWGSMRNGACSARLRSARRSGGNASSSSAWPTPCAQDDNKTPEAHMAMKARMKGGPRHSVTSLQVSVQMWPTPNVGTPNSQRGQGQDPERRRAQGHQVMLQDAARFWPTPNEPNGGRTTSTGGYREDGSKEQAELTAIAALWPTPRTITGGAESADRKQELGRTESGGGDLQAATALWNTPMSRDSRDTSGTTAPTNGHLSRQAPRTEMGGQPSSNDGPISPRRSPSQKRTGTASDMRLLRRRLNPRFVEWLQNWPEGWATPAPINSACSAMASYRSKQRWLLQCCING